MTAKKLLDTAASYLGVREAPPDSNRVLFNTAYYGREVSGSAYPWCCVFIWYIFREAGAAELFYGGGRTASCTTLYTYYSKRGQTVPTAQAQPGDLAFFVFDGNTGGIMNHVGIVESVGGGYITTIDGNTGTASQDNGGAVMRRRRALSYAGGTARPNYQKEDSMTKEQFKAMMDEYLTDLSAQEPSGWSADARAWAEKGGIITGDEHGNKKYGAFVTREQLVQFLHRVKR